MSNLWRKMRLSIEVAGRIGGRIRLGECANDFDFGQILAVTTLILFGGRFGHVI